MKISYNLLVLFMIGHLVSLLHARVESPLQQDEYFGNETLLSNTSQCRGRLSEESEMVLKRLIYEEKKQLIYLQLNANLINTIQTNVSEILFPSKWVWVTNDAGRPLLELDFRYDVYSLTTLSLDVGEMMVDIEIQNNDEGLDYNELLSLVICSIHDATEHETTPRYSVCHSILSAYDGTGSEFYLQYRCCGRPSQKFNSQDSQLSNNICQVIETDRYSAMWSVVFYPLYVVSPLLIKFIYVKKDNEDKDKDTKNEDDVSKDKEDKDKDTKNEDDVSKDKEDNDNDTKNKDDGSKDIKEHKNKGTENEDDKSQTTGIELPNVSKDKEEKGKGTENEADESQTTVIELFDVSKDEEDKDTQNKDDKCQKKTLLYVNFDSSTPLHVTRLIQYILLLKLQNPWICTIRRFCFFLFMNPCVIYMMMAVDATKYHQNVKLLSDMEKELNVVIVDFKMFDRLWLWQLDVFLIISITAYGFMTIIISASNIVADTLSRSKTNNDRMGFMKLPSDLCLQHESGDGFLLLYEQMIHRFSLLWERKFWKFWFTELRHSFTPPRSENIILKGKCRRLLGGLIRLTTSVLSILWILPVSKLISFSKHESWWKKAQVVGLSVCMVFAHAFIFTQSCATVSMFILYTIKGTVKHYMATLPFVTIILVIVYYIVGTIHGLEEKYMNIKNLTFDECISLQKDIDDGKIQGNVNFRLVVYKSDGIPKIPKELYDLTIEKHLPLRKCEFFAVLKLFLIVIFSVEVGFTVDAFNITYAMTLGQTIAAFFAFSLPTLLEFFHGHGQIEAKRLKFQVRKTVEEYYTQKNQNG